MGAGAQKAGLDPQIPWGFAEGCPLGLPAVPGAQPPALTGCSGPCASAPEGRGDAAEGSTLGGRVWELRGVG